MSSKKEFSPEQEKASDPARNVWVQANAGTGKTSVLVQRLLRILFRTADAPGGDDGILCLTYTNAGAGEMRNRILAALREWATADDEDLRELLRGISHERAPTGDDLARARAIFYEYIDNPNTLKIRTIHGFCEEILRRFPLEAGIQPAWKLTSGADQKRLLKETFQELINNSGEEGLNSAFSRMLDQVSEYSLDDLLDILTGQYRRFFNNINDFNYKKQFINTIKQFLNIGDAAERAFYSPAAVKNRKSIPDAIAAESKQAGYLLKISEQIKKHSEQRMTGEDFGEYKSAFLTAAGTKIVNVAKKGYLAREQDLVYALSQESANREIYENTIALFELTDAFAAKYRQIKLSRGLLDFDDLILYVNKLFSDPSKMGWVLSQLDNNVRHILVDEAQDTSPEQWEILRSMTTNFFTDGDKDNPRSLFVVGDTKQSIFSFQGADPESFAASKDSIGAQIENDLRQIAEVPLAQSFRSTAPILSSVDYFFNDVSISSLSNFNNNPHKLFRAGDAGLVELHPLSKPAENQDSAAGRREFVCEIAGKIENLLQNEQLESAGRPILPSDIMVLVQRRAPFAAPLIAELQSRNIPVAGSDRIKLPEFPAIRDLLNLSRFAVDPTDDYMLACTLKSPLFRMGESELFKLCNNRNKNTLFSNINELNKEVYKQIKLIIAQRNLPPYSFFMRILNTDGRREKMIGALGRQIIDPLEEFLTICLSYERTQSGGLQDFIKWFVDGGSEITRDTDANAGVRIVTTHGSKGLEAPIIFLIDTIRTPRSANAVRIAEPVPISGAQATGVGPEYCGNTFLWRGRAEFSETFDRAAGKRYEIQLQEYYRLLYVAMTRARDRLYIYGFNNTKEPPADAWHTALTKVLPGHPDATADADGVVRISCAQTRKIIPHSKDDGNAERRDAAAPKAASGRYSAALSAADDAPDATYQSVSGFLDAREASRHATGTGTETHRRLQYIVIDGDATKGDAELVEKIAANPEIAAFFGKNARAEVPIAGTVNKKFVSRRIDRLAVDGSKTVRFLDYKTDIDKAARRDKYAAQMAEYAQLLRAAYPGRTVSGHILWLHDWKLEKFA